MVFLGESADQQDGTLSTVFQPIPLSGFNLNKATALKRFAYVVYFTYLCDMIIKPDIRPMENNPTMYWIYRDGKKVGFGTYDTPEVREALDKIERDFLLNLT